MSDHDDRSDRIDLRAWVAPPTPPGLADRALARVTNEETDVAPRAATATATVDELPRPRTAWSRGFALAVGSAAVAAAATWWLTTRALPAGEGARRTTIELTQTTGAVEYRNPAATRLRIATPLATIELGPEPTRLTISPSNDPEAPVNRKHLAIGGGAVLLAAGITIAVHEGTARVSAPDRATTVVGTGQRLIVDPTSSPTLRPGLVAHATRDRGLRDQVAQAISAAQARRASLAAARPAGIDAGLAIGPSSGPDDANLPLKRDDIRKGVREVAPMLGDCYQQELLDRGFLSDGKLIAHLVVETEPDLGTVVTVDDQQPTELEFVTRGSATAQVQAKALGAFVECVELTLESVVLPPMAADGRLSITYPFAFAADDGEDDDSAGTAGSAGSDRPRPAERAPSDRRRVAPTTPKPATPASPPRQPAAAELVARAGDAASTGQYARTLALSEQALAGPIDAELKAKALTLAGLAACNTRNRNKARTYYAQSRPSRQTLLRMACLKQGIELAD